MVLQKAVGNLPKGRNFKLGMIDIWSDYYVDEPVNQPLLSTYI